MEEVWDWDSEMDSEVVDGLFLGERKERIAVVVVVCIFLDLLRWRRGNPGREAPSTLYNCCFARLLLNFIVDRMNTMDYWRECIALGTTEKISWIYPSSSELNVCGAFPRAKQDQSEKMWPRKI